MSLLSQIYGEISSHAQLHLRCLYKQCRWTCKSGVKFYHRLCISWDFSYKTCFFSGWPASFEMKWVYVQYGNTVMRPEFIHNFIFHSLHQRPNALCSKKKTKGEWTCWYSESASSQSHIVCDKHGYGIPALNLADFALAWFIYLTTPWKWDLFSNLTVAKKNASTRQ